MKAFSRPVSLKVNGSIQTMAIETWPWLNRMYVRELAYRQTEGYEHLIASILGRGIEIPDYSTWPSSAQVLLSQEVADSESREHSTHPADASLLRA